MASFDEVVKKYEQKQKDIMDLEKVLKSAVQAIQEKIDEETNLKVAPLETNLKRMIAEYQAEMKAEIGICDGEKFNVLEAAKAFRTIGKME